jgi:Tol biopolymer transport system component
VPANLDIWILDIARGTQNRLTFDAGFDNGPVWSPDITHLVQASREGFPQLNQACRRQHRRGLLASDAGASFASDWSADGVHRLCARRSLPRALSTSGRFRFRRS